MAPPLAKVKKEKKSRPAVFRRHQHDIKHRVGVRAAAPPRPTTPLCPTRARGPAALPRPPCPLPSRRRRHPEIIMSAPSLARGGSIGAPPGGARGGGGGWDGWAPRTPAPVRVRAELEPAPGAGGPPAAASPLSRPRGRAESGGRGWIPLATGAEAGAGALVSAGSLAAYSSVGEGGQRGGRRGGVAAGTDGCPALPLCRSRGAGLRVLMGAAAASSRGCP